MPVFVQFIGKCPIYPSRHGVNSIPELELMSNSGIGIAYLKKGGIGIDSLQKNLSTN